MTIGDELDRIRKLVHLFEIDCQGATLGGGGGKPGSRPPAGDRIALAQTQRIEEVLHTCGDRLQSVLDGITARQDREPRIRYDVSATLVLLHRIDASANWRD